MHKCMISFDLSFSSITFQTFQGYIRIFILFVYMISKIVIKIKIVINVAFLREYHESVILAHQLYFYLTFYKCA